MVETLEQLPEWDVKFEYLVPEYGEAIVPANSEDEAEDFIRNEFDDVEDLVILETKLHI